MTTHSTASSSVDSIGSSPTDTSTNDETEPHPQPDGSSLTPQLEALADIWEALQSLPDQEASPTEYLETADTRSQLESQLQTRLKHLGAEVLEQFLHARDSGELPADELDLPVDFDSAPDSPRQADVDLDALLPELHGAVTDAPNDIDTHQGLADELDALHTLLGSDRLSDYASLPDELHRAMLTVVVARMRRVQTLRDTAISGRLDLEETISELFRTLGRHLNRFDPGYIRGMKLEHDPYTDSWIADITHWSSRLGELCNDYLATPLGHHAPDTPDEPEHLDAHRALNSIEQSIDDDASDHEDLRDLVAAYLDRGLNASHPRLVDLLAPHSDLFTSDRFRPLQHAFSAID
jgi:hypothetical protein